MDQLLLWQMSMQTLLEQLPQRKILAGVTRQSSISYHSSRMRTSAKQCPRLRVPRWWMIPINLYSTPFLVLPSSTFMISSKFTSLQFFSLSQQPLRKRERCRMRQRGIVQRAAFLRKRIFFLHFQHCKSSISSSPRYSSSMSLRLSGPSEQQQREVEDLGEKGKERLEYLSKLYLLWPQGQVYCLSVSPQNSEMILLFSSFSISFTNILQFSSTLFPSLQLRSTGPLASFSEFSFLTWSMNSMSSSCASCCSHPRTISMRSSSSRLNYLYSSRSLLFLSVKNWAVSCCWLFLVIGKSASEIISNSTCRTAEMQQVLPRLCRPSGPDLLLGGLSLIVRFWGELVRWELRKLPYAELEVPQLLMIIMSRVSITVRHNGCSSHFS